MLVLLPHNPKYYASVTGREKSILPITLATSHGFIPTNVIPTRGRHARLFETLASNVPFYAPLPDENLDYATAARNPRSAPDAGH